MKKNFLLCSNFFFENEKKKNISLLPKQCVLKKIFFETPNRLVSNEQMFEIVFFLGSDVIPCVCVCVCVKGQTKISNKTTKYSAPVPLFFKKKKRIHPVTSSQFHRTRWNHANTAWSRGGTYATRRWLLPHTSCVLGQQAATHRHRRNIFETWHRSMATDEWLYQNNLWGAHDQRSDQEAAQALPPKVIRWIVKKKKKTNKTKKKPHKKIKKKRRIFFKVFFFFLWE